MRRQISQHVEQLLVCMTKKWSCINFSPCCSFFFFANQCFHVPYSALTMFISSEQKERDSATAYSEYHTQCVCKTVILIILSPPKWLKRPPCFLQSIRDDGGGSGHCCGYSHPGADSWYGERSLPPRTRWHQLLSVCRAQWHRASHFPGWHGKQT